MAGPGWTARTPKGITKVIHSETELVSVVGRTQLFNPADLDNVKKIQSQYKVQTLSAFLGNTAPSGAPEPAWVKPVLPSEMKTSLEFFNVLNFVLQFCPAPPSEKTLRAKFEQIGIVPGKTFDVMSLSAETRAALQEGMSDGQKIIDARRESTKGKNRRSLRHPRAFLEE